MYFSKDIEKQTSTLIKYVNKNKDFPVPNVQDLGWMYEFEIYKSFKKAQYRFRIYKEGKTGNR